MHAYVIGQTGTGKSTLLFNVARQDATKGRGFCLVDPHGDLAEDLHTNIAVDHTYWNVSDPNCHFGYNPITGVSPPLRPLVADGLIAALKKQWQDAWGPRMEHLLRQSILTLLEIPGSDLRDIMRLLLERSFRDDVVARIDDPQLRQFWQTEFRAMNYRTAADGVSPVANKLGALLAHPIVRKALCAPKTPLRLRHIMDTNQVVIINLGKGLLGADTSNVLGGILVSSIVNAAFSRANKPEMCRTPFILMVDEFHHFSTGVFADALSECRKYGLGTLLAQQHTAQTDPKVLAAILGNVGTIIALRIGALDAPLITRALHDVTADQLIKQPNYRAMVQLMVQGEKTPPFTATLHPPQVADDGA